MPGGAGSLWADFASSSEAGIRYSPVYAGGIYGPGDGLSGLGLGQCDPSSEPCYDCPDGSVVTDPSSCPPVSTGGGGGGSGYGCWDGSISASGPGGCPTYTCPDGAVVSTPEYCATSVGGTGSGSTTGGGGGSTTGGSSGGGGSPTLTNPASAGSQISSLGTFFGSFLKSLTGAGQTAPAGYHYVGTTLVSNLTGLPATGVLGTTGLSSSTLLLLLIVGGVLIVADHK